MNKEVDKRIRNICIKCQEIADEDGGKGTLDRDFAITTSLEMIAELCHLCMEQAKQIDILETLFKDYVDVKGIRNEKIDKLLNDGQ